MSDAPSIAIDYPAVAAAVRADLWRHQVAEREHLLVEIILRLSFDHGRAVARVGRLEDFHPVTGFSRGNVCELLRALGLMRIVDVAGETYRVLPRTAHHHWLVKPRFELGREARAMALLCSLQTETQPDLLPRDKTLREQMAELAVESALEHEAPRAEPALRPAPPFPNQERIGSRIRNGSVPESGTAAPPSSTEISVLEISNSDLMSSGRSFERTQLTGRAKGRFEQAATDQAIGVTAHYRADGYVMGKLERRPRLRTELMDGKTPTARKFAVLYARQPDQARALLGAAIEIGDKPGGNAAAYLNTRLRAAGVAY